MNIVLDTDVYISATISSKGAANLIIKAHQNANLIIYTSTTQIEEFNRVVMRNQLTPIVDLFENTNITHVPDSDDLDLFDMVNDKNNLHILQTAVASKANYLVTFNIRDYQIEKIKRRTNITCFQPGPFLQYLRSQGLEI